MTTSETPLALDEPVTEDGIRWLNYFNGRVLSAEDMRTEQGAIARARRQLGRVIGPGVAAGFRVNEEVLTSSPGAPVLTVTAGIALDDDGQAIELCRDIRIGLIRVDQPTSGAGSVFERCDVVLPGTVGLGAYVLTVEPASAEAGKAVVAGLGNQPASCNVAYSVEGVRFQLVPVPLHAGDTAAEALLRNRLAYRLFGAALGDRSPLARDAFGDPVPSLLDDLHDACFGSGAVPLAVIHWKPLEGLKFVDMWAVRRRPAAPASGGALGWTVGEPAGVDGEAMVLQFQDHLAALILAAGVPAQLEATVSFEHLPPVGVVPVGGPRGIDPSRFFAGMKTRGPFFLEGAKVRGLVRRAASGAAVEIATRELVWRYEIRQNEQAVRAGEARQRFEIFTSGFVPYDANAQFDLARWDFANYALRVS